MGEKWQIIKTEPGSRYVGGPDRHGWQKFTVRTGTTRNQDGLVFYMWKDERVGPERGWEEFTIARFGMCAAVNVRASRGILRAWDGFC
jgi:hypothetical protein